MMEWVEGWLEYYERDIELVYREFLQGESQMTRQTPIFRIAHDRDLPEIYRPKCERCGETMYYHEGLCDWRCEECDRYYWNSGVADYHDDDDENWWEDDYFWEDDEEYFPEEDDDWDLQEEDTLNGQMRDL